jgi:hypothetical protein
MGLESNPHRGLYYLFLFVAGLLIAGTIIVIQWVL